MRRWALSTLRGKDELEHKRERAMECGDLVNACSVTHREKEGRKDV